MREFEEFTYRDVPGRGSRLRASLQTKGSIAFNRAAFEALGKPEAVTLLFDRKTRAVGLKPSPPGVRHAYKVSGSRGTYSVNAQAFAGHYGIDMSRPREFEPQVEDGVLVIELDKGTDIAPRRRGPRPSAGRSG